jgi:hypothetical protein
VGAPLGAASVTGAVCTWVCAPPRPVHTHVGAQGYSPVASMVAYCTPHRLPQGVRRGCCCQQQVLGAGPSGPLPPACWQGRVAQGEEGHAAGDWATRRRTGSVVSEEFGEPLLPRLVAADVAGAFLPRAVCDCPLHVWCGCVRESVWWRVCFCTSAGPYGPYAFQECAGA